MLNANQWVGRKIYVYAEAGGDAIAKTTIYEAEPSKMYIKVQSNELYRKGYGRVTVLLLGDNAVYEYKGNLRRSGYGTCEIALFQGKERENRTAPRYNVQVPISIDTLLAGEDKIAMKTPLEATVCNISTSGALLRAKPNALGERASFQLRMHIGGNETIITTTVMWVNEVDEQAWEYGCAFTAVEE